MVWLAIVMSVTFLVLLVALRKRRLAVAATLEVDDIGIRRQVGDTRESVRWDELVRIYILTSDEGPFVDDVFWLFLAPDEQGCLVPGPLVDDRILSRVWQLPDVDVTAMLKAVGSTENASFLVWSRDAAPRADSESAVPARAVPCARAG